MKRWGAFLFCAVFLLMILFVGCNRNDVDKYTVPLVTNPDYFGLTFLPVLNTLDEYYDLLDNSYIPQGYVTYDDISFIGQFHTYTMFHDDPESVHTFVEYGLIDQAGYVVGVSITMDDSERLYPRKKEFEKMDSHDNFRYAPESYPDNAYQGTDTKYSYKDIIYTYSEQSLDGGKPYLSRISWSYNDYYISIKPGFRGGEDRWDGSTYPEDATDTFVGRLLDPDTAQEAVDQFNAAIRWVNFRDGLVRWLPVVIPALCVAAVGTVYLIIRHKRKRAAARFSVQEGEPKTEE